MSDNKALETVKKLFTSKYNEEVITHEAFAPTGSYRQYFRLKGKTKQVLGVYNKDLQENKAYISFTRSFRKNNIQVPEILSIDKEELAYLVEDMGEEALFDFAHNDLAKGERLSEETMSLFRKSLTELHNIQTKTIDDVDLSYCYPRDAFDQQSMLWDLNYFKYFFLRLMRVAVDEQLLENDIQKLASELDKVPQQNFLFRDFQSRNIMIKDNKPYFIDFQGGRKGAIYYDVASLLYDANVQICNEDREKLLIHYYEQTAGLETYESFKHTFNQFAIVRLLQALGAFGLRGVVEKKPHFKECIPFALKSLSQIFNEDDIKKEYKCIAEAIDAAIKSEFIRETVAS